MRKYWLLLILPALLLIWWGVSRGESAPQVHFSAVRRVTIESTVSTNGKVEPAQWAAARAETAGVVRTVSVQLGQNVSAGQTLVSLDTAAAASDLAAAQAREQEAQSEANTLGQGGRASTVASLTDAVNTAEAAVAVAQKNYDSLSRLSSQGAATKLQVVEAQNALDRAKLQLVAAQNQRRTLITSSDRVVAQAKLHDAEAAVALARHRLALGVVVAPMSGTVYQLGTANQLDIKIGAYLQPGELVARVGNLDQVKVTVYVDEPDIGRLADSLPVRITWDARPGQQWWGKVEHMPTEVIALGTRTVGEVSTIIQNPNHDLLPGVSVNATIVSRVQKDAMSIPKAALRTLNGNSGAYVLKGGSLTWTRVQTGISDVNNVEILSGLRNGDLVADRVVEPSDAEIRAGMRVRPLKD